MTEFPKKITDDPYGAAILIRRLVMEQGAAYWRRYLIAFAVLCFATAASAQTPDTVFIEKQAEMLERPQLDIAQIGLVCVLGYADFRFADCGWRKAYPKLDAFHEKMLARPSVKVSLPPPA